MSYGGINTQINEEEEIEKPEISPHTYSQLIFDKGEQDTQWRKDRFFKTDEANN